MLPDKGRGCLQPLSQPAGIEELLPMPAIMITKGVAAPFADLDQELRSQLCRRPTKAQILEPRAIFTAKPIILGQTQRELLWIAGDIARQTE